MTAGSEGDNPALEAEDVPDGLGCFSQPIPVDSSASWLHLSSLFWWYLSYAATTNTPTDLFIRGPRFASEVMSFVRDTTNSSMEVGHLTRSEDRNQRHKKRQKVAAACDPCRGKKVKCDGLRPGRPTTSIILIKHLICTVYTRN